MAELLAAVPALAKVTDTNGSLLFYLPADEDRVLETAELLLAHGADPLAEGKVGNGIDVAERRGLDAVAELLRSHRAGDS